MSKRKSDAARLADTLKAYKQVTAENGRLRVKVRSLEGKLAKAVPQTFTRKPSRYVGSCKRTTPSLQTPSGNL